MEVPRDVQYFFGIKHATRAAVASIQETCVKSMATYPVGSAFAFGAGELPRHRTVIPRGFVGGKRLSLAASLVLRE
ncbi:hypothetical protein DVH05_028066 [Phytophthora capsici]|nr:hypothetical protein DVH05_028066 [Phytophthora capsici]